MSTLIDFYTRILRAGNLIVNDEGLISSLASGEKTPFLIEGKRAVLPTKAQLAKGNWTERIAFHPGQENIMRGESVVVAAYRKELLTHLQAVSLVVMIELITLAASQARHAKLNPEQSEVLRILQHVDKKTLERLGDFGRIMASGDLTQSFLSVFIRKNGVVRGTTHARAAIVNFPLYEALVKDGQDRLHEMQVRKDRPKIKDAPKEKPPANETFGVDMREADRESLIGLFEYIFPNIQIPEAYSTGNAGDIMPTMDALMHSIAKIGGDLNDVIDRFADVITSFPKIRINDEWAEDLDNLIQFQEDIRLTPMQPGNNGLSTIPAPVTPPPAAPVAQIPPPPLPAAHQQQQAPQQRAQPQQGQPIPTISADQLFGRQMQAPPQFQQPIGGMLYPAPSYQPQQVYPGQAAFPQPMQYNHLGQPIPQQQPMYGQQMPVDAYGRPIQQQQPMYGQPQQQYDAYGRPIQQQPMGGHPGYYPGKL